MKFVTPSTFLTSIDQSNFSSLKPCSSTNFLSTKNSVVPLSNSAFTVTLLWLSNFSIPISSHTSLRDLSILLTSLSFSYAITLAFSTSNSLFINTIFSSFLVHRLHTQLWTSRFHSFIGREISFLQVQYCLVILFPLLTSHIPVRIVQHRVLYLAD